MSQTRACSALRRSTSRGDDGFARIAFVRAEDFQIKLDAIGAGQSGERGEALRLLDIRLVAARKRRGNGGPFGFGNQRSGK
jgi:hypothetical protein